MPRRALLTGACVLVECLALLGTSCSRQSSQAIRGDAATVGVREIDPTAANTGGAHAGDARADHVEASDARADEMGARDESAPTGVLCLSKLPGPEAFRDEGKGARGGREQPLSVRPTRCPKLSVSVDQRDDVVIDRQRGACLDGLSLEGDHVANIARDGRPFLGARFSFARTGGVLELRYDPFYQVIKIEPPRRKVVPRPPSCAACEGWARRGVVVERDLGTVEGVNEPLLVPQGGIKLNLIVIGRVGRVRTMVLAQATAPPVGGGTAVSMTVYDSAGKRLQQSDPQCFEALVESPPFTRCTAQAGVGWTGGAERPLSILIENASGRDLPIQFRILVTDPLD